MVMERDPVCSMTVDQARAAAKAEYAEKTYYFCSAGCAAKFQADPDKYLSGKPLFPPPGQVPMTQSAGMTPAPAPLVRFDDVKPPSAAERNSTTYVCPMHPEVRRDQPGTCPKCGMSLEPNIPPAPATRTQYVCPMHPQIVRAKPGACPICGMTLEPRTATADEEENPALLDQRHPGHPRRRARHVRPHSRPTRAARSVHARDRMDSAGARHAGGP